MTNTEKHIYFLVDESIQFIWNLRKAGDKNSIEEFRERLRDIISFADFEIHEVEIKNNVTALLNAGINDDTAGEMTELAKDIRGFVREQERNSA